ncbi:hypothetical protein [Stieleria mannarensis]|uniref:hypothetical protein n=1 Tax=Stieleria mannarensis TaxID=2755585 RepID=UPI0016016F5C|nr:hypothetical protein [Rhodopirellula sp. JC639]
MRFWMKGFLCALAAVVTLGGSQIVSAGFTPFVIREGGGSAPAINSLPGGGTEIVITQSGQKAALGSSDIDGTKLGDIGRLSIERLDNVNRFTAGSGPAVGPYLNFWITDGTNFAVVANEPSNAAFQPLFNNGYDLTFADLADKTAKIYEAHSSFILPNASGTYTFSDFSNYTILAPTGVSPWPEIGTGAPMVLGNRPAIEAYGVNWVFGDTLSNYVSGDPGYQVQNAMVNSTVPEPTGLAIACCGLMLTSLRRKRRR